MRYALLAVLHIITCFVAQSATDEQTALMRQYHLSVPPVILGRTEIPEPVRAVVDPETAALMRQYHLSVPPIIQPRKQIVVDTQPITTTYLDQNEKIARPVATEKLAAVPVCPKVEIIQEPVVVAVQTPQTRDTSPMLVLMDFYATWCHPCTRMKPSIDQIEAEHIVTVVRVDVDAQPDVARKYSIDGLPHTILFSGNTTVEEHIGYQSLDQLHRMINPHVGQPSAPVFKTTVASDSNQITVEQRELMRRYHLSVPPIIRSGP